jgi:hypothetical protein
MITICFVYFRNLTLANLEAALYSVRRQDFSLVESLVFVDNNTDDAIESICSVISRFCFPVPVYFHSFKHGNPTKTHAWSTNKTVHDVKTPWVFFTRADYLLEKDTLLKFSRLADGDVFITGNGNHLDIDIARCERLGWREELRILGGTPYDYTPIDTGVWLTRKDAFDRVGGLDEGLTAWGHAQTHFQWKLHKTGTQFLRIPEVLFYHPQHGGEKDLALANQQVAALGINLREMWARYEGPKVY